MNPVDRTPVQLITGLDRFAVVRVANCLTRPGTALISLDLRGVDTGHVVRAVRRIRRDGSEHFTLDDLELEHGCASCTIRLDLLPLLRTLSRDPEVERIVVALDPTIEPEPLAVEVLTTIVDVPGLPSAPAADDVAIDAVICAIDAATWLPHATGDETAYEAGVSAIEDERTLAQIAVAQTRFADVMIVEFADRMDSAYDLARLHATLLRLNPLAAMRTLNSQNTVSPAVMESALADIPDGTPRGRPHRPFDPLLAGYPDLTSDCGIALLTFETNRPFHPERLHDEFDCLLDGVVTARGRMWLAANPDDVLWLESAGGALGVARVGSWLAAAADGGESVDPFDVDPEYRALAALHWDPVFGDRHTSLTVLTHRAEPAEIDAALTRALVTHEEFARGPEYLASLPSPFGDEHTDPCDDMDPIDPTASDVRSSTGEQGEDR
ncbi:MAG: GTP-binding protein [Gordonia sp. (in: high G+C Gram-positive bacteria)]